MQLQLGNPYNALCSHEHINKKVAACWERLQQCDVLQWHNLQQEDVIGHASIQGPSGTMKSTDACGEYVDIRGPTTIVTRTTDI